MWARARRLCRISPKQPSRLSHGQRSCWPPRAATSDPPSRPTVGVRGRATTRARVFCLCVHDDLVKSCAKAGSDFQLTFGLIAKHRYWATGITANFKPEYDLYVAADYKNYPECRWIEEYVRQLAPSIDTVQCGRQLNGDYELWLKLGPTTIAKQLIIPKTEYEHGGWKTTIPNALEQLNS